MRSGLAAIACVGWRRGIPTCLCNRFIGIGRVWAWVLFHGLSGLGSVGSIFMGRLWHVVSVGLLGEGGVCGAMITMMGVHGLWDVRGFHCMNWAALGMLVSGVRSGLVCWCDLVGSLLVEIEVCVGGVRSAHWDGIRWLIWWGVFAAYICGVGHLSAS